MKYATFWQRFAALFIDSVILQILALFLGLIIGVVSGILGVSPEGVQVLGFIAGFLLSWLYYALMESSAKQATLGKMAMEIYVTDLDGKRLTFARATGRDFAKIISVLTLLIGYLMVFFTDKKQALHDQIAGTLVVQGK